MNDLMAEFAYTDTITRYDKPSSFIAAAVRDIGLIFIIEKFFIYEKQA